MALRIASHLSESHRVIVCTTKAPRPNYGDFQVLNNLRGRTEEDVRALNRVDVDMWLAMNELGMANDGISQEKRSDWESDPQQRS
jgi:hypothetical protein